MKSFNRFLLVAGITLGASVFGAGSALAAETETINLSGTVAAYNNITVDADTGAAITLATDGVANLAGQKIADISVASNDPDGFTLTATPSDSTGNLTGGTTGELLSYVVAVDGANDAAAATYAGANAAAVFTANAASIDTNLNVYIQLTTAATVIEADTYTDAVVLTVAGV